MIHPPRPVLLQPTPLPRWPVMTKKGKPRTPEVATRPRATPSRTSQQAPPPGGTDGEPQPRRPARTARSETWRGSREWVYTEFQKYVRARARLVAKRRWTALLETDVDNITLLAPLSASA